MTLYYFLLFAIALCSTWWIFKKVLRIALLKGIVDNPDARKLQKVPVPVLGGIAVFFGIVVSMTATGLFYETGSLFAILGVMSIMLYVGVMDDILSLSPSLRFLIEILVVLLKPERSTAVRDLQPLNIPLRSFARLVSMLDTSMVTAFVSPWNIHAALG